jgi:hypothetical protein
MAKNNNFIPQLSEEIQFKDEKKFTLWLSEVIDILEAEFESSNGKHGAEAEVYDDAGETPTGKYVRLLEQN